MPELPEIHGYAKHVNQCCANILFSHVSQSKVADRKQKHNIVSVLSERNPYDLPFQLSSESRGKELCLCIRFIKQNEKNKNELHEKDLKPIYILFRFGMSGKMIFTKKEELLKHSHLSFYSSDGEYALSFVDQRQFGRYSVVSPDQKFSSDRSPDPVFQFVSFVNHLEYNLKKKKNIFQKPICEVLLDQKYFNGIGNYLRAEILYRCNIKPFEQAQSLLENALKELNMKADICHQSTNVIQLCHDVCQEVIDLDVEYKSSKSKDLYRFKDWLTVYKKADWTQDGKGRKIWFYNDDSNFKPFRKHKKRRGKKRKRSEENKKEKIPRIEEDDQDIFIEEEFNAHHKNIECKYPLRGRRKIK